MPQSLGFFPGSRCTWSLPQKCNFCSRCLMFMVVSLGCVSLGLLAFPGMRTGLLWRVRGSSLPRGSWGSMLSCCLQPSPEVRICPVGEMCTKCVGVCLHIFSALNKICLSLEFKAFYEGKSSLILLNDLAEVNAVMLIFAACFSGVLSLFTPTNSWGFSLIGHSVPLAPMSPLIFFGHLT